MIIKAMHFILRVWREEIWVLAGVKLHMFAALCQVSRKVLDIKVYGEGEAATIGLELKDINH